jgi:hypothetical protein
MSSSNTPPPVTRKTAFFLDVDGQRLDAVWEAEHGSDR